MFWFRISANNARSYLKYLAQKHYMTANHLALSRLIYDGSTGFALGINQIDTWLYRASA
jgi:hypothetical protein